MGLFHIDDDAFSTLDPPHRYATYSHAIAHVRKVSSVWRGRYARRIIDAHPTLKSATKATGITATTLLRAKDKADHPMPDLSPYVVFDFSSLESLDEARASMDAARDAAHQAMTALIARRRALVVHVMERNNRSVEQSGRILQSHPETVRSDYMKHKKVMAGVDGSNN